MIELFKLSKKMYYIKVWTFLDQKVMATFGQKNDQKMIKYWEIPPETGISLVNYGTQNYVQIWP